MQAIGFVIMLAAAAPVLADDANVFISESETTVEVGDSPWRVYLDPDGDRELDADGDGKADRFEQPYAADQAAKAYLRVNGGGEAFTGIGGVTVYRHTVKGRTLMAGAEDETPQSKSFAMIPPETAAVIYVDAPGGPTEGNDANDGTTPATAVASIERVKELYRSVFETGEREAWILFRRGDVWEEGFGFARCDNGWRWFRGDRADKRTVIGAYGDGDRPTFRLSDSQEFWRASGGAWVTIRDLRIVGQPGSKSVRIVGKVEDLRFIDCDFDGATVTIEGARGDEQRPTDVRFVGCTIRNLVVPTGSRVDLQGIFASRVDGLVIDRCVFDLVGWNREADGSLTPDKRNHGAYIAGTCGPSVVRDSVFTRCAGAGLQMRSGGVCERVFFADNGLAGLNIGWMRTSNVASYPPGPVPITVRDVVIHHRGGVAMRVGNCAGGVIERVTVLSDEQDALQLDALENKNVHGLSDLVVRDSAFRSVRNAVVLAGGSWKGVTVVGNKLDGKAAGVFRWEGPGDGSIAVFADPEKGLTIGENESADLSSIATVTVTDEWIAPVISGETTAAQLIEQHGGRP